MKKLFNTASTAYTYVTMNSKDSLKASLRDGPVAVAFSVGNNFFNYKSGVFTEMSSNDCDTSINHGMVGIGYGTDETTGNEYVIVKNSWGTWWGEEGYVRISIEGSGSGTCDILQYNLYPNV